MILPRGQGNDCEKDSAKIEDPQLWGGGGLNNKKTFNN